MPLDDYTFKLGDSGVVLNDDPALPFVDIEKVTGLDSPPFRETTREHEGVDGGFLDAEFERGRDIILEGVVYADETGTGVETFMDSIKFNYAPVTAPIPFYFKAPGVEERLVFVKSRGVSYDWDQLRRLGMARIQFKMFGEDPRIYTSVEETLDIPFSGFTGSGFSFSLAFSFGFGAAVLPPGGTVTNSGNRPAPAIITIDGPVTDPRITNDTLGLTLSFVITLSGTDSLVIDLGSRTAILNGTTNVRGTLIDPTWWLLAPGDNSITYTAGSGTGSNLNITFRSAWR
jgi:hypothetical protein